MLIGESLHLVVIDQAGLCIDTVLHGVVQLAGKVHLGAVCQVTSIGQAHAEDVVAGFEHGHAGGRIRLRTGMRLDVGIVGTEQFLGAIDRQLLRDVHVLATAIVTFARVAFGVLVGQYGTLRLHDPRARIVFRRDQLDMLFLAAGFLDDGGEQLGIKFLNGRGLDVHGVCCAPARQNQGCALYRSRPA